MDDIVNSLKQDYVRFLQSTNKYTFKYTLKENMMESFLLSIASIIALIISFLTEKALAFLLPSLQLHKKQIAENVVEHNFLIKENKNQVSLLTELNFCKSFYTPC